MYLVIENTKKSFQFPDNHVLLVGNDFDCDVQINHPKIWGRHFSITEKSYGCVLEVFDQSVRVNGFEVKERCLLDTGDLISVDELNFRLLDDQYIPRDSALNHTNVTVQENKNVSSVYGIRSFTAGSMGQFIIDDFHHQDGWHVFRQKHELHFVDNKHTARLNGMPIAQAKLSNGDIIANGDYKYRIELPGTSGFSKFSPSHPRNVLLSESMTQSKDESGDGDNGRQGFLRNNLWWLTILVGLIILLIVILSSSGSNA
ncbi:FHA domain-containing protein [Marinicella sediminis]|uniref:FHA domain-containing protein n=1 Tax=Marinicella sediminis TaxID=1792834 RepID=A0ABV7JF47_9GAMM|nr:FHA domain-containing protein [Marinicella sediminis]